MIETQDTREVSPRSAEDKTSVSYRTGGRKSAPRVAIWLPVIAKCAAAIAGAILLAIIGANAGAHGSAPNREPSPAPSPSVLGASFIPPAYPSSSSDAGPLEEPAPIPDAGATAAGGDLPTDIGGGLLADGRVVLNVASEADLTRLPGIGPSRAKAIVALRQHLSKFRAVEDLLRVKGVGRKMLRRLRPNLVLDRPAGSDRVPPAPSGGGGTSAPPAVNRKRK